MFAGWIESGFPDDVRVSCWARDDGSGGIVRMKASDVVETARLLLNVPLLMPVDLAAAVREYVAEAADGWPDAEVWADDGEPVRWTGAVWHLTLALDWKQRHAAAV